MNSIKTEEVKSYLESNRDNAIRSLWITLRSLSDVGEMSEEDLELWSKVTRHSSIQERLSGEF